MPDPNPVTESIQYLGDKLGSMHLAAVTARQKQPRSPKLFKQV